MKQYCDWKTKIQNEDKGKEELINLFLFFGLVLLSDVLFVPMMKIEENHQYQIDWENSLPPYLFFPVLIFLVIGLAILWFRRNQAVRKRPTKIVVGIALFLILYRCSGIFSFPYGQIDYVFSFQDTDYTVLYAGLSAYNRITTFLSESYFIVFLLFLYSYLETFSERFWVFLEVLLWTIIAVAFISIVYSCITEGKSIYESWMTFFESHGEDRGGIYTHTSFTSHRNVFGFLLMMAIFSLDILFFRHHGNTFFYLPMFVIWFYLLSVFCRTAIILSTILILFTLVYHPILYRKRDKAQAFVSLGILCFVLVFVLVMFVVNRHSDMMDTLHDHFMAMMSNQGSLDARQLHNEIGFALLNSFYYGFFGYTRPGMVDVYQGLENHVMSYEVLWTCHNTYLQIWLDQGFLTLMTVDLAMTYLLIQSIRIAVRKDWSNLSYTAILVLLMCYSALEPRGLFLKEGSSVLFLILVLLPIHYEDRKGVSCHCFKKTLIDKLI